MKIAAICVCVLLAGLSARQITYWRDNVTLWTHAAEVTPQLARPAINLAVAYRQRGEFDRAERWLIVAEPLAERDRRREEYRLVIAREVNYLEIVGHLVCDQPLLQSYC